MVKSSASCAVPACSSSLDAFNTAMAGATTTKSAASKTAKETACPLNKEALGHMTWSFLHTTAIYFPSSPTKAEKEAAVNLVESVATLYPCVECKMDFQESIKATPPQAHVSSKTSFSKYLCNLHNEVNEKLGKDVFSCDMKDLEKRWRTGCGFGDVPE